MCPTYAPPGAHPTKESKRHRTSKRTRSMSSTSEPWTHEVTALQPADMTGKNEKTIRCMIADGRLPVRIGVSTRYAMM